MSEEDDFDDIEWEQDVEECEEGEDDEEEVDKEQTIQINITEAQKRLKGEPPKKKPRKERVRHSVEDYDNCLSKSRKDTSDRLKYIVWLLESCCNGSLIEAIRQLVPSTLQDLLQSRQITGTFIATLLNWIKRTFTVIPSTSVTEDEGRDGSNYETLCQSVLATKTGSFNQLYQILFSLLQSYQIRCRFIFAWELYYLAPQDLKQGAIDIDDTPPLYCWLEVLTTSKSTTTTASSSSSSSSLSTSNSGIPTLDWTAIDLQRGGSNQDTTVVLLPTFAKKLLKKLDVIISCELFNKLPCASTITKLHLSMMEITSRYALLRNRFTTTLRLAESFAFYQSWLHGLLTEYNERYGKPPMSLLILLEDGQEVIDIAAEEEMEELQQQERAQIRQVVANNAQRLPTSFADFKHHPVYLLKRHLLHNEMIHPENHKPVALFKGEAVYNQEQKEHLHTKLHWRKYLRIVKPQELPMKIMKMKARKVVEGTDTTTSTMIEQKLYGKWQTDPLQIPPVVDGILPTNKYGNMEIWDGMKQFVPNGAVYIEGMFAIKAAKVLGMAYAPAVTGFENKGLGSYPKFGGVVVLKGYEGLVKDAMYEIEAARDQKQFQDWQKKITDRWYRLVKLTLSRQRLREEYEVGKP